MTYKYMKNYSVGPCQDVAMKTMQALLHSALLECTIEIPFSITHHEPTYIHLAHVHISVLYMYTYMYVHTGGILEYTTRVSYEPITCAECAMDTPHTLHTNHVTHTLYTPKSIQQMERECQTCYILCARSVLKEA